MHVGLPTRLGKGEVQARLIRRRYKSRRSPNQFINITHASCNEVHFSSKRWVRLIDSFPFIFRIELPILILDPAHIKLVISPVYPLGENLSISSSLIRRISYNLISHLPRMDGVLSFQGNRPSLLIISGRGV